MTQRASGVLLHISSLPSPYGIGTFGQAAYEFIDLLAETKQTYWQVLPLSPTSYGDSPYQSFSAFAGNTHFIDLDRLAEAGWLDPALLEGLSLGADPSRVDYDAVSAGRRPLLEAAVAGFLEDMAEQAAYEAFLEQESAWLTDFALFMALKEHFGNLPLQDWPDRSAISRKKESLESYRPLLAENIRYHQVTQYFFFSQWQDLWAYAEGKGIQLIGDMPIYVSADSVEVWCQPELFKLDADRQPLSVAGCPPDAFSDEGQLWGNPIYDWAAHKATGYAWWLERIKRSFDLYHVLRIDHFRGFSAFWEIDGQAETAKDGSWQDGPGYELFALVKKKLGDLPIIAEDLGDIDDQARQLLTDCGYPGMAVLAFAFDDPTNDSTYLPHNTVKNSVAYIGTHDNPVVNGWFEDLTADQQAYVCDYLHSRWAEPINQVMLRALFAMTSQTAIATMQDILDLPAQTRMNTPSTLGGNWQWRLQTSDISQDKLNYLTYLTKLYQRVNRFEIEEEELVEDGVEQKLASSTAHRD